MPLSLSVVPFGTRRLSSSIISTMTRSCRSRCSFNVSSFQETLWVSAEIDGCSKVPPMATYEDWKVAGLCSPVRTDTPRKWSCMHRDSMSGAMRSVRLSDLSAKVRMSFTHSLPQISNPTIQSSIVTFGPPMFVKACKSFPLTVLIAWNKRHCAHATEEKSHCLKEHPGSRALMESASAGCTRKLEMPTNGDNKLRPAWPRPSGSPCPTPTNHNRTGPHQLDDSPDVPGDPPDDPTTHRKPRKPPDEPRYG